MDNEIKEMAVAISGTTRYLDEEEAKIYAKLFIKAVNAERKAFMDEPFDENEIYPALKLYDTRF